MKAFQTDIENQEQIEQWLGRTNKRIDALEIVVRHQNDNLKKETLRAINDMKRENKKELNLVDSKLLKMIGDIRIAQTVSDEN